MNEINKEIGLNAALRNLGIGNGDNSPDRGEEEKKWERSETIDLE